MSLIKTKDDVSEKLCCNFKSVQDKRKKDAYLLLHQDSDKATALLVSKNRHNLLQPVEKGQLAFKERKRSANLMPSRNNDVVRPKTPIKARATSAL